MIAGLLTRTIESRMETMDYLHGAATSPMTDTQIKTIETKLLNLAIDGDGKAAQQSADFVSLSPRLGANPIR